MTRDINEVSHKLIDQTENTPFLDMSLSNIFLVFKHTRAPCDSHCPYSRNVVIVRWY